MHPTINFDQLLIRIGLGSFSQSTEETCEFIEIR